MDEKQFDRLVKSLSTASTRRRLLHLLAGLPAAFGLVSPVVEGSGARGRHHHTQRQRRADQRDRIHDEKKKKKKKKKPPTPPALPPSPVPPPPQGPPPPGPPPPPPTCAETCFGCWRDVSIRSEHHRLWRRWGNL